MINCIKCGKPTKNKKFCSRSCANSHNNSTSPKRKLTKVCKHDGCNTLITSQYTYCSEHNPTKGKDYSSVTISELVDKSRKSHYYSHIRYLARKAHHNSSKPKCCANCGYDKHIEVAHIKAISSYCKSTTIGEVNNLDNLLGLCRNCHWELDYGDLTIEQIKAVALSN